MMLLLEFHLSFTRFQFHIGGDSRKSVKEDKFLTELLSSEGKVYNGKEREFHFRITCSPFRTKYP